jgi:SAM-dependent MidA family methyltransferase
MERFDEYVDRCLYGDDGFYATRGEAGGARGDFVTSPEVGPLFGHVVGRWLDGVWTGLGEPGRFTVVEAGAGRGALANAILASGPRCAGALDYVTVERSSRLRDAQRELLDDAVTTLDAMPNAADVVLANELLDNLTFRLVVRTDDGWDEVYVDEGRPVIDELDDHVSVPLGAAPLDEAPPGTRLPVCEWAHVWVREARGIADRVLVIDYGVRSTEELIGRDWLRTYRGHDRGGDPFEAPGRTDITCDVPFDQLPAGAEITTQAEFLHRWGIDDLVDEGRRIWTERAHLGDLEAIRARSRVTEAEALLDPAGLGGFLVAEWAAI